MFNVQEHSMTGTSSRKQRRAMKGMRQSMQVQELKHFQSFDLNPELVKKLADLTKKINKMERTHFKETQDLQWRSSLSRDSKQRSPRRSPRNKLSMTQQSPEFIQFHQMKKANARMHGTD